MAGGCALVPEVDAGKRAAEAALTEARAALAAGRFGRAIERSDAAVAAAQPIGDRTTEIAALNLRGRAQRNLAHYDDALAAHDKPERAAAALGDRAGFAEARRGKGDVYERRKDHPGAIALYRQALAALQLPTDWRQAAETLYQIGDIEVVVGQFDQALDSYGTAHRYAADAGDADAIARSRDYLGYANRRLGDYDTAARWHRQALVAADTIVAPTERHRARARALNHLGLTLHGSSQMAAEVAVRGVAEAQLTNAILDEQGALDEAVAGDDRTRQGYVLRALAQLHFEAARLEPGHADPAHVTRARALAERAVALGHDMRLPEWRGLALHQLGIAEARLGDTPAAIAALDQALAIWTTIGDSYSAGHLHMLRARELHEPTDQLDAALDQYAAAQRAFEPLQAAADLAELAQRRAILLRRQGRFDAAATEFGQALALSEQAFGTSHASVARNLNWLVRLSLDQGRYDAGLALARRATAINRAGAGRGSAAVQTRASPETGFRNHVTVAQAVAERDPGARAGLTAEAFEIAQLAHGSDVGRALGRMAARFASGTDALAAAVREREAAIEQRRRLDRRLLDSLASPPAARDDARETALRQEIADIEARLATLDERLTREFPAYAELADARPLALAAAQALLGPDEALLLYAVTDDPPFLAALRHDRARVHRLAIGRHSLAAEVQALRERLEPEQNPSLLPFDAARAFRLHQVVLAPAMPQLDGTRHVFVVPDGALQSLPFGVLVTEDPAATGAAVAWLARRHAVSVLPTVSSLRALRVFSQRARASAPFLGIGDPALDGKPGEARGRPATLFRGGAVNVDAVRRLPALPDTADELRALATAQGAGAEALMLRH